MYFLLKLGIFHCYVSLPEGNPSDIHFLSTTSTEVPQANSTAALCMIVHHGDGVKPGGWHFPFKVGKQGGKRNESATFSKSHEVRFYTKTNQMIIITIIVVG